jgi:signal transduction histidine kinase
MAPLPLQEITETLGDIRRDDLRASELIQRMRAMLRKSEAQAVALELNALVQTGVDLLASEARARNIVLRSALAPAPLTVAADPV